MQMDLCTQSGMLHHDGAGDRVPDTPSPLMPHCAFCTLVSGGFAAVVAAPVTPVFVSMVAEESRLSLPEVRPLAYFSYPPAHPRAPPAILS
jgi:hypothetical protein